MSNNFNGDLQKKIFEKVVSIETKVDNINKVLDDHEKRLRFHDKIIWAIIVIVGILEFFFKYFNK